MNLERYNYSTINHFKEYEFYSEGPKGKIRKTIRFTKLNDETSTTYNLGFGDKHPDTGLVDDNIVTDNKDRSKVLATVAYSVIEFSKHHNNPFIIATGNTPARTRLYQMGIAGLLEEIKIDFQLYGWVDSSWQAFQRKINYKAFLIKKN